MHRIYSMREYYRPGRKIDGGPVFTGRRESKPEEMMQKQTSYVWHDLQAAVGTDQLVALAC